MCLSWEGKCLDSISSVLSDKPLNNFFALIVSIEFTGFSPGNAGLHMMILCKSGI